ncbi:MAG: hypothetical protein NXI27_11365 [Alphaproteobacteria bacterium]|nr:hypothetical protein [Alphaproteobacteria bacterium]
MLRLVLTALIVAIVLPAPMTEAAEESGPLDGMVFAGKFGDPGAPGRDDLLYFNNGKFWSAICIRCGFEPGEYWVRKVGDSIHFRGEQRSERGIFLYRGRVTGDKIQIDVNWTKDRWYWKIDRDLVFEGSLTKNETAQPAIDATNISVAAQSNLPDGCW